MYLSQRYLQVEALEVAQSKTVSEVKELRNQHNQSRRKLERLEADVANVRENSLNLTMGVTQHC